MLENLHTLREVLGIRRKIRWAGYFLIAMGVVGSIASLALGVPLMLIFTGTLALLGVGVLYALRKLGGLLP